MEQITVPLILFSLTENLLVSMLIFSLLALKLLDKKFVIFVFLITIINIVTRSFPVTTLVLLIMGLFINTIMLKIMFNMPVLIIGFSTGISLLFYIFIESMLVPVTADIINITINQITSDVYLRIILFLPQIIVMLLLIFLLKHFNFSIMEYIGYLSDEDLELVADEEVDLVREKKISNTLYLVFSFLLFQGLFINANNWTNQVFSIFDSNPFFNSQFFSNLIVIALTLTLMFLIQKLFNTLRLERNDIIRRIKEKNALRLDWEKRAQMHDRNHHLGMLYTFIQVDQIDRAREYLKGMIGEMKNINEIVKTGNQFVNALVHSKMCRGKQVGVTVRLETETPMKKMPIDDWDLNRILGNLLDNAIEAVETKRGKKLVELFIRGNHGLNEFEVRTYGVLIPDRIKENIFKRGYTSKEEKGHGLGLAICKELIDQYHGNINIYKNKELKYTSFVVTLPTVGRGIS